MSGSFGACTESTASRTLSRMTFRLHCSAAEPSVRPLGPTLDVMPSAASRFMRSSWYSHAPQNPSLM